MDALSSIELCTKDTSNTQYTHTLTFSDKQSDEIPHPNLSNSCSPLTLPEFTPPEQDILDNPPDLNQLFDNTFLQIEPHPDIDKILMKSIKKIKVPYIPMQNEIL